jgi:Protein of unknown function (DUF2795)
MMMRGVRAHPKDAHYNLRAVSYPASKQDLIAAAEADGANEQGHRNPASTRTRAVCRSGAATT